MEWNKCWKSSKRPGKQRLYRYNAPRHILGGFLAGHLSVELRKKHGCRSLRVRKGDKVKVLRGQFRGKSGTVDRVDVKKGKVFITGIEYVKKDGGKFMYGVHASNLLITDIASDKYRLGGKI